MAKQRYLQMCLLLLLFLTVVVTAALAAYAQPELPPGLQKISEYNRSLAESTLRNVSFLIAFLGGVLSFLAPCTVALLPAFFAYSFKDKKHLTKMTLIFFAGFAATFVILGLLLTSLGKISFVTFQQDIATLIRVVGVVLIFLGLLTIFGKGFTFLRFKAKLPHDYPGTFLFGSLFALGWSACIGPIIAGIFVMTAVFKNYFYSALLLFFYALGLAVPLFLAAVFFDKFNLANSRLVQGINVKLSVAGKNVEINSTKLVSGLLFILLGVWFVFNKGTTSITTSDLLGIIFLLCVLFAAAVLVYNFVVKRLVKNANAAKIVFVAELAAAVAAFNYLTKTYGFRTVGLAEQLSDKLLQNPKPYSILAAAILLALVAVIAYFFMRERKE